MSYYMLAGFKPISMGFVYLAEARRVGAEIQDEVTRLTCFGLIVGAKWFGPLNMANIQQDTRQAELEAVEAANGAERAMDASLPPA